ncbi:MAG: SHOCT domain-containing protein [Solirubrobacteraceae bacterium]
MFGNKKKLETQLAQQGGTVAWATVIDAKDKWASARTDGLGGVSNRTDHMRVSLRVEPDGQEPFEATLSQAFKGRIPMKGWQCKVIYDPSDPSKIAIQEDTITPPGIDHDRAERVAVSRKEMMDAARSGNIAEYVEDMKAKALSGQLGGFVMVDGQVVSGGQAAGAPAPAKPDLADQLTKLADLRDRGVLTDAEFEAQKAKLLAAS